MPLLLLVAAFVLLAPLAVWIMRRDYRDRRRLSWAGFGLLTVWFFLPHLALDLTSRLPRTWNVRATVGLALMVLGVILLLVAVVAFRSVRKVFARDPGLLTVTGPYRWSRNPQYVAWFLFVAGYAVIGWTWWCAVPLLLLAVAMQRIVLVEEEHLARTFGPGYRDWCRLVPRWIGVPRRDVASRC